MSPWYCDPVLGYRFLGATTISQKLRLSEGKRDPWRNPVGGEERLLTWPWL